jgi:DNA-binding XRE family transcriptional regulator
MTSTGQGDENMSRKTLPTIDHCSVELDGVRYVILREKVFQLLCEKANVSPEQSSLSGAEESAFDLDKPSLAEKLLRRRQTSGLSQAELARRAGVRPETLNRIERGKTTPDFATVRKLVVAMNEAEKALAAQSFSKNNTKES